LPSPWWWSSTRLPLRPAKTRPHAQLRASHSP